MDHIRFIYYHSTHATSTGQQRSEKPYNGQGAIISSIDASPNPESARFQVPSSTPDDGLASRLRDAMRGVAATVTIVTTNSPEGTRYAMIASSFTSVSLAPPTVLVCVNKHASISAPLLASRKLCINVLNTRQQEVALQCARVRAHERFSEAGWQLDEAGLPYLEGAQAVLTCEIEQVIDGGSHHVVLGRVVRVVASSDVDPLLYLDGRFVQVSNEQGKDSAR
ncbi:TPA: flavin reductase family protein [Morganella morganii]|nr:flavin reductase family protein [Morganella morganii]